MVSVSVKWTEFNSIFSFFTSIRSQCFTFVYVERNVTCQSYSSSTQNIFQVSNFKFLKNFTSKACFNLKSGSSKNYSSTSRILKRIIEQFRLKKQNTINFPWNAQICVLNSTETHRISSNIELKLEKTWYSGTQFIATRAKRHFAGNCLNTQNVI